LRNLEFHFAALGAFLPAASSVENCIFDLCSTGIAMDGGDVTLTGVTFYDVNVMIYFWANTPSDGQIVNAQNVQGIVCGDFVQTSPDLNLNYMALTLNNCCFDSLGQDLAGYGQAIQSAGGSFSWTPCVAGDYDGDGMPDSWEEQHFGNTDQTGTDDYDGDGVNNLQEYNNGINSTDPNKIRFAIEVANNYVNTSSTSVELDVTKGVPSSMAILVDSTNFAGATWTSYDANPSIYLGTNQGWHEIWIGLRGRLSTSQQTWEEVDFNLDTIAPVVVITNPVVVTTNSAGSIVTQPYLQLQGYANEQLQEIYFDVTNAAGVFTNEQGFVTDQGFDTNLFDFTTNYFQCYDVPLTNGLNRITVRVTDLAGNTTTTNINVTLDYSSKTPPVIKLFWPQNGEKISGDSFTWRGWVDDFTATVSASIVSTNGETNVVQGLVERDGNFWVENLPMPNGTNLLTLTVTDIATNICSTNITVSTSPVTVTMTPIDDNQLWQPRVSAHGEIISGSTYFLWINGVKATVNGNAWSADNVPMTAGGTAVFNITLYEPGETQPDNSTGN
jgi:hypothetical protein